MSALISRFAAHLPARVIRYAGRLQWLGPIASRLSARASRSIRTTDLTISHGVGSGLRFNAAGTHPGYALGTSEPEVQEVLRTYVCPGSIVYDVGAGVGFHAVIAARLAGPTGRVVAFEPHEPNRAAIEHNLELNGLTNVQVIARAVGDQAGTIELVRPDGPDAPSLLVGHAALFSDAARKGVEAHTVESVSIDELVEAAAIPEPSLVKIDVEGAEPLVIHGMTRTLERCSPLVLCELHGTKQAVTRALTKLSYDVSLLPAPGGHRQHLFATPRRATNPQTKEE